MRNVALAPLPRWFGTARMVLVAILVAVGMLTTGLFLPSHHVDYRVGDGALVVDVQLGLLDMGRTTPVDSIRDVRTVDPSGSYRTSGTGMHDLCHGQWTLPDDTRVWMATTCTSPALLLDVDGEERPWVVSPDDPAAMAKALKDGTDGHFPARAGASEPAFWTAIRFVTPLVFVVLVPVLARMGRGLNAAIDGDQLVLKTGWRTLTFQLAGARMSRDLSRHGMWRIKALRLGPVQLGRFRGAAGPVQMLVTDPAHAIEIIPTEGIPVVVSPEDPDAFVAACAAAGAVEE